MRKAKKTLSVLLSVIMIVLTLSALSVLSSAVIDVTGSGKCGDNINWSLSGGVLTVTGTGEIKMQTREVEKTYTERVPNEETEDPDDYKDVEVTYTDTEYYYPWEDAIEKAFLSKYGVEDEDELWLKMEFGALSFKEIYQEIMGVVTKLVIGEGITAIDDDAFSGIGCMPQTIVLPSTLTTLGENAITTMLASEIVINNPALDFEVNEVEVTGFAGETTFATAQEAIDAALDAEVVMMNVQLASSFAYYVCIIDHYNAMFEAQKAEITAAEGMTDEEKAQALADIAKAEADLLAEGAEELSSLGITPTSLADAAAKLLVIANQKLGTSFTSPSELYTYQEGECECTVWDWETQEYVHKCNCCQCGHYDDDVWVADCTCEDCDCCNCAERNSSFEYSEALRAAIEALQKSAEDANQIMAAISSYNLGSKPEATDSDNYDPETGTYGKITLTPAPWLTVYGAAESTAKSACTVSQVKFVVLDDAKAAFDAQITELAAAVDAQAKDGDSDASKKLIADAKAAIAAIAYDNNKTPEENKAAAKAAADAITAKLASDLDAQRGAECHWCGKVHGSNFFQKIIAWFHNIFAKIFGKRH